MTELGRYANNVIDYVKSYKHLYIVTIIISSLLPVLVSSVSSNVVMAVEGRNVGPSPSLVTRYSLYSAAVSSRLWGGEGGGHLGRAAHASPAPIIALPCQHIVTNIHTTLRNTIKQLITGILID